MVRRTIGSIPATQDQLEERCCEHPTVPSARYSGALTSDGRDWADRPSPRRAPYRGGDFTWLRGRAMLETIRTRVRSEPTAGRHVDLHWAEVWRKGRGVGLEDVEIGNDRPIREVALNLLAHLDWDRSTSSS